MIPTSVTPANYPAAISWVRFISKTLSFPITISGAGKIASEQDLEKFLDVITQEAAVKLPGSDKPGGVQHAALGRLSSLISAIELSNVKQDQDL